MRQEYMKKAEVKAKYERGSGEAVKRRRWRGCRRPVSGCAGGVLIHDNQEQDGADSMDRKSTATFVY